MKNNLVYYIMTYVMYLYPPFVMFMIMINFEDMSDQMMWTIGFLSNLFFVLITIVILYLLAVKKKIPKIEKDEKHHMIFGLIGNLIIFLYVYQNQMNIEKYVSVFSLVLLLVLAYRYLISNQISFKEIFVFSIVFGVVDYIIIIFSGNTLFHATNTFTEAQSVAFQILFSLALLFTVIWYGYQLIKHHQWSLLRYVMISLIGISLILYYVNVMMEIVWTIAVLAIFSWLIDIILKVIHKVFKLKDLVYYARVLIVSIVFIMIKDLELYRFNDFNLEQMFLLIAIFYVTAFSDILMTIANKKVYTKHIGMSMKDYLSELFKSVTSRYKDIVILTKEEINHELFKTLGRHIYLIKDIEALHSLDKEAISLVIIYHYQMTDIKSWIKAIHPLPVAMILDTYIADDMLETSFTDYHDYVYTISSSNMS